MWATIFKYVSQFLLLPLIKELIEYVQKRIQTSKENKKLKEENAKKGEAYDKAPVATAHDGFDKLP